MQFFVSILVNNLSIRYRHPAPNLAETVLLALATDSPLYRRPTDLLISRTYRSQARLYFHFRNNLQHVAAFTLDLCRLLSHRPEYLNVMPKIPRTPIPAWLNRPDVTAHQSPTARQPAKRNLLLDHQLALYQTIYFCG
jgi:hypothetical protein